MNLLFVNDIPFNPIAGGLERVTDNLARELRKRGHSIYYLCGKLSQSQLYLLDYEFPAKLYQLPNYDLFRDEENLSYYKQLQSELKIDIVINQRGAAGEFNNMLPATNVKLISVLHSTPECYMQASLNNLVESSVPPFVELKKIIKGLFPLVFRFYWRRKLRKEYREKYIEVSHYSDAIVTLSETDKDILKKYILASDQEKVYSIGNPNTFDVSFNFSPRLKRKVILYVGRLTKSEKKPLRLLMIWKMLHFNYPDWQLKIVGDGEEKNAMLEYVKTQNLSNVSFEGQKANVASHYKEASFVCLTSDFEGWGMALTEGMQYGCIPVTFNNYGAASTIIDDRFCGCLIPPFDLKQYANRLSELMDNENMRIEMSKAAIEKVKLFSVERVVEKWEDLFRKIL